MFGLSLFENFGTWKRDIAQKLVTMTSLENTKGRMQKFSEFLCLAFKIDLMNKKYRKQDKRLRKRLKSFSNFSDKRLRKRLKSFSNFSAKKFMIHRSSYRKVLPVLYC